MITLNNRMNIIFLTTGILLLIPLIAMQFTDEVNWSVLDFVVMGTLLLFFGFTLDFMIRKVTTTRLKILVAISVIALFLLIWGELAVGIFGTPFSGN